MRAEDPGRPDPRALSRARQALRCLPFRLAFYCKLEQGELSSNQLASRPDWAQLSRRPLSPGRAEDHFIWLIRLGVLRRAVDGQGLTERVRLTPLGRDVVESFGSSEIQSAGPVLRLQHWLRRHRPRW